jgi:hypothetical protein
MLARLEKAFASALGLLAVVTVLCLALPSIRMPRLPSDVSVPEALIVAALWAVGRVGWRMRGSKVSHDRLKPRRRALPPAPIARDDHVAAQILRTPRGPA